MVIGLFTVEEGHVVATARIVDQQVETAKPGNCLAHVPLAIGDLCYIAQCYCGLPTHGADAFRQRLSLCAEPGQVGEGHIRALGGQCQRNLLRRCRRGWRLR